MQPHADERELPRAVALSLKALAVLYAVALVVVPEIPAASVLATDPLTGKVFMIRRGGAYDVPFSLAWAFEGWRIVPLWIRLAFLVVVAGLCAIPAGRARPPGPGAAARERGTLALAGATVVVATIVLYVLRVTYDRAKLFGDVRQVPRWVEMNYASATEAVTMHLYSFLRWVRREVVHDAHGLPAVVWVVCVAGGAFVAATLVWARRLGRARGERAILFGGATLSGSLVMFFGYPETTPIALAAIGLYLACGATVIASADPRALTTAKVWSFASATFAVTAHGAGLLLLPSLALLVVAPFGAPPGSKWARWKPLVSGQSVSLFIALVVAPILAISVLPYFPVKNLGNMTGGGDDVMLVPLTINYAHRDGGYYPFVSWWHFLDIANAMWIAAPFAVPLLVGAAAVKRRCRIRLSAAEAHALAFIAAAAAFCLFIPVAWNHDFGMWGDWNIAVCYLFPLNALAWLSAIIVLRRFRLRAGHWLGMLAPLVLVQAACAVGLMALLY